MDIGIPEKNSSISNWNKTKSRFLLICILIIYIHPFIANAQTGPRKLYPILHNYVRNLYDHYEAIPEDRRRILEELASYIRGNIQTNAKTELLFIGTNNSTRTQFARIWAETAAYYYRIDGLSFFSGGTSPGPIDTPTILALEDAGFIIYKIENGNSLYYEIKYSYNLDPLIIYSQKYNDDGQPNINFASIVVCANADINLPVIKGTNFRTSLHYFDPKAYLGAPNELDQYKLKCHKIALEMFYLFYLLKR